MNDRFEPAIAVAAAAESSAERPAGRRGWRPAALLATASLIALLCEMPKAAASDCADAGGAPPADIATPTMLYETLRARTSAQLLAIGFLRKPVANECAWIYEVKMLTASGSVVELDFAAADLDLIGARGPDNDGDAAALVRGFGGDAKVLRPGSGDEGGGGSSGAASGSGTSGDDGGDDGGNDDGGGGEGGNSGSGSGSGGSGSGSSGSGGGGEGGDSDGGGEGGGDSDGGGEGGEGGDE